MGAASFAVSSFLKPVYGVSWHICGFPWLPREIWGEGFCPSRPCPALLILSFSASLRPLGPLEMALGREARGEAHRTGLDCSLGPETSSLQHVTHATTFRYLYLPTGPPAAATHSLTLAPPPALGPRGRGATSAWTEPLPEVT